MSRVFGITGGIYNIGDKCGPYNLYRVVGVATEQDFRENNKDRPLYEDYRFLLSPNYYWYEMDISDRDILDFITNRLDMGNTFSSRHYWSTEKKWVLTDGPLGQESSAPISFGDTIRETVENAILKFMINGCTFEQAIGREAI